MPKPYPDIKWPRSTPEAQGIPSAAIEKLAGALMENGDNMHSLLIIRNGYLVSEEYWAPYHAHQPHNLFSASKSFTSTLIGIAQDEQLLNIYQKVWDFFPEYGKPKGYAADMTIQHLLTMSTGHTIEPTLAMMAQEDWVKVFLETEVPEKPGSIYLYNTGATYMLSAILTRVTGQSALEYGLPRLFEPLGIRPYKWLNCPKGISTGGFGLAIRPQEMARLGYLYLRKGLWNGRRIVSEAWVADASRYHTPGNPGPNNWCAGYGYQFWRNDFADSYRADGYAGQFIVILPHEDMVVVMTEGVLDANIPLESLRHILLPTLSDGPLPEDPIAFDALCQAGKSWERPNPVDTPPLPDLAKQISGRTYQLNQPGGNAFDLTYFRFHFPDNREGILELGTTAGGAVLRVGFDGLWRIGPIPDVPGMIDPRMAVKGHWEDDALILTFMLMAEPTKDTMRFTYNGNEVRVVITPNLPDIFRKPQPLDLTGHAQ